MAFRFDCCGDVANTNTHSVSIRLSSQVTDDSTRETLASSAAFATNYCHQTLTPPRELMRVMARLWRTIRAKDSSSEATGFESSVWGLCICRTIDLATPYQIQNNVFKSRMSCSWNPSCIACILSKHTKRTLIPFAAHVLQ